MKLTIRQAKPSDRKRLKEIVNLSFGRFFRFFAVHSVESANGKILVVEVQSVVVGFVKLTNFCLNSIKYGCILWLAVHPSYRCQGIASALVRTSVEDFRGEGAIAVFASIQRRNKASLMTFAGNMFIPAEIVNLWRLFGWRILQFYMNIWYAPSEIVLMKNV